MILYVGKLTARKHPERLLDAAEWTGDCQGHVMMVGSGPLDAPLKAEAAKRGLANITWLGFVNQSQLPSTYAAADIFVMPADREPWGLVLNEAMASGLAPIVSRDVGAAMDLIDHGRNGFSLESCSGKPLRDALLTLVRDPDLRRSFGEAARVRSFDFSYEATAGGVLHALTSLRLLPAASSDAGKHGLASSSA